MHCWTMPASTNSLSRPQRVPLGPGNGREYGQCSTNHESSCASASLMESLERLLAFSVSFLAEQVEGQALADVLGCAHRVDALLHLAKAAIAPLHGVARARQQPVVQVRQRFLQGRPVQLGQRLAQLL